MGTMQSEGQHTRAGGTQCPSYSKAFGSCCRSQNHMETYPVSRSPEPAHPQRQQRRPGEECLTKMEHLALQPEVEGMPKRCRLQSAAENGTAPWHIPLLSKGCAPSCLELHLWSHLGSLGHQLLCICAQHQSVSSTNLQRSHGDPGTPRFTVSTVPWLIT